jgi:2-oxoglutarate dehydrogenase E1 component
VDVYQTMESSPMIKQLFEDSPLFGANAPFIEGLYEDYLQNPESVPSEWHHYFDKLRAAAKPALERDFQDVPHGPVIESFFRLAHER